jgi:hypothetical protein
MNWNLELLVGPFALSGCFWLLYGFYAILRVQWFIVDRYERETDLMSSVFFREHANFTRALPDFFSSSIYTGHLSMCLWGWRLYGNRKAFRDITDPSLIVAHFSQKEIRRVKKLLVSTLIVTIHVIALYIFRFIWPETFG